MESPKKENFDPFLDLNCRQSIATIETTQQIADKIQDAVYYATIPVAQHLYPLFQSVYDEDAGVFTDYGMNQSSRTWAQIHFRTCVLNAVIFVDYHGDDIGYNPDRPVTMYITDIGSAALTQLLWTLAITPKLQEKVYGEKLSGYWDSDGHYSGKSKKDFIDSKISKEMLDKKTTKRVVELIQDARFDTSFLDFVRHNIRRAKMSTWHMDETKDCVTAINKPKKLPNNTKELNQKGTTKEGYLVLVHDVDSVDIYFVPKSPECDKLLECFNNECEYDTEEVQELWGDYCDKHHNEIECNSDGPWKFNGYNILEMFTVFEC